MTSRELRNVETDSKLGLVRYESGQLSFQGGAGAIFARKIALYGEQVLGADLMANGWSNGYLYLGPPR